MTDTTVDQLVNVTLYHRLGASAGIRRLVDGIVDAHLRNPTIKARFLPYLECPERVAEIKHQTCMFFSAECGGSDIYRGRSMAETHRGMNISEAEYEAAVDDIIATMTEQGHDEASRTEVRSMLNSLKDDIVGV
ncbi:hemoglobin [Salinihabitans flavidus]|uniref:Hemoglobin n=1 Tax=Salinihabitans flavidus TaxID=569882 RepID=A0A1H8MHN3_9RHOB|nr:group 1 truncated hemoglobin [Salinihabitans flavidus]SEO16895.1 hemoglobin [Salinihabitans flavidus]